ncbi:MFS transporter [Acinetobacter pittii]
MLIFSFFQNALKQFESDLFCWVIKRRNFTENCKWGSVGFIVGGCTIGAILEIVHISMLPILLLIIASLAFIWSFTIREPDSAPTSQKHLGTFSLPSCS